MKTILLALLVSMGLVACNSMEQKDDMSGDMKNGQMEQDGMMKDDMKKDKMSKDM